MGTMIVVRSRMSERIKIAEKTMMFGYERYSKAFFSLATKYFLLSDCLIRSLYTI